MSPLASILGRYHEARIGPARDQKASAPKTDLGLEYDISSKIDAWRHAKYAESLIFVGGDKIYIV